MIRNRRSTDRPGPAIRVSLQQTPTLRWVYIEDPITGLTHKVNLSGPEPTIQPVDRVPSTAIQSKTLQLA
ncbi:hypothetical protein [Ruegeria sp. HKCCD7318]|uniref:hypothetical protein n=1 Tax=Ruegeria sp. HKCCD7318 TaxID=2683014 RepID=UPI001491E715|nr:hypothetical protein [Ruegeria sp. HKCCD7318]NOE32500.1 hypothetical protein [Ruegeria sp. HKCCD7318]